MPSQNYVWGGQKVHIPISTPISKPISKHILSVSTGNLYPTLTKYVWGGQKIWSASGYKPNRVVKKANFYNLTWDAYQ